MVIVLSVPLDHLKDFTFQVGQMGNSLLSCSPPITGLDPSIVISPARLHLTLGVMALDDGPEVTSAQISNNNQGHQDSPGRKTVQEALSLLQQLKPDVQRFMNNKPLQLTLDELAVMRRSPEGEADVMYLGPSNILQKTEEHLNSVRLVQMIHERFRDAHFITDRRPLKLHCTVVNTSQRRSGNRRGPRGVPFSIHEIEQAIAHAPGIVGDLLSSPPTLTVRELKICRMGSHDAEGRYVRVGGIEW
ncbi:hypothetical protein RhiJN_06972 [Ceratobasidium sp. AG-Ba]|nr:hypothetical protein RhiJN_06972 [Ceratobasidium sp. AG-Ba]QRW07860.1 hypothetical protein RhiLY_06859 [Ceratobasidium sp. AG-Ba]